MRSYSWGGCAKINQTHQWLVFVKNRLVYFLTSFSPTALRLGGAGEDETEKSRFQITPPRSNSESQHGFCKQTAEFIY